MSVEVYSTPWCPFCVRARALLDRKGLAYTDIDVSRDPASKREMMERSGRHTVPQIWVNGRHVGGCDELMALERSGRLDEMVASERGDER